MSLVKCSSNVVTEAGARPSGVGSLEYGRCSELISLAVQRRQGKGERESDH